MNYFSQNYQPVYPAPSGYDPYTTLQFSPYSDTSPPAKTEPIGYPTSGTTPGLNVAQPTSTWYTPSTLTQTFPVNNLHSAKQIQLSKVGGWKPTIVLVASLALLAAGCFSLIAQHLDFVFRQSVFNSRWINASAVSAILAISGTILTAGYIHILGLIGRMWLWKQMGDQKKVKLGQVMVIASKGALDDLLYAVQIGKTSFLVIVAIVWIIPPAFNGALQPTWGKQTDFVSGDRRYFYIAGSGGNASLPALVDCFDRSAPSRCPAREYYADHHMSMQFSLGGYSSYYQSFGIFQNTTPPASVHMELSETWNGVDKRRLDTDRNMVTSTACVPVVNSTVSCAITANPPGLTISGGRISYSTVCGQLELGDVNDSPGGGYVNTCQNEGSDNNIISLYYTFVPPSGSSSSQVKCDVALTEHYRWVTFHNADGWFDDQGECADGHIDILSYTESIPLVSSVAYVLAGSTTASAGKQSGSDNPLYSLMQAWLLANTAQSVERIQLMVASGVSTASTIVYALGYRNNEGPVSGNNVALMDAWVEYNAYTWSGGFKGYLWAAFLLVAAICGIAGSVAAFFVPRLRYDPGSYAQTMFLNRQAQPQGDTSIRFQPLPRKYGDLPLTIDH